MAKELERDLGLYAVVTISMGAMIGSGIFVLPGLALKIAGPAAVLAYLLAGLTVLPAALSKAEMATAMPDAGGTYLYIDRAMGPLMGTIAGFGAWFSLTFKSAFALVGLGAYLLLFLPAVQASVTVWVAVALAVLLVVVNVVGVKQTGGLQAIIVTGVLAVLALFIADGVTLVESARFDGFFGKGLGGLLEASGFVFVSYAGVTKIASVAEEVEDPGHTLPAGMLISVVLMMLVYTLVVLVVTGVADAGVLEESLTPMAAAADAFLGPIFGSYGKLIVAGTAVLALTSMANAGVLASSRFPFAMSRDDLVPDALEVVSERFRTPIAAIALTGAGLVALILFVDVVELAKLASAFKILVFSIVNVAVIAFRENESMTYEPEFEAPGYPWIQLGGIGAGGVLLTQMGTIPAVGAVSIVVFGIGWYYAYAKGRTEREGASVDVVRRERDEVAVGRSEIAIRGPTDVVLVPVGSDVSVDRERTLLRAATDLVPEGGEVRLAAFEEVPDQMSLIAERDRLTDRERAFEERSREIVDELDAFVEDLDVDVEISEVVSHDVPRALGNYIERQGVDVVVLDGQTDRWQADWPNPMEWLTGSPPCHVVAIEADGFPTGVDRIAVASSGGPFGPVKVSLAHGAASRHRSRLRFLHLLSEDARPPQVASAETYHEKLAERCSVPTESRIVRGLDEGDLRAALEGVDVLLTDATTSGASAQGREALHRLADEDVAIWDVYPHEREQPGRLQRWMDRVLYR
jgi:amino acid transporter